LTDRRMGYCAGDSLLRPEEIAPLIHHCAALTGAREDARYWSLTLEFGRRFARMAVDWCDAALAAVTQEGKAYG